MGVVSSRSIKDFLRFQQSDKDAKQPVSQPA